jgi:lipopolysaccharide export system protein LptA
VLAAGVLLVGALVALLAVDKWKQHFNIHEVLKPLGYDIQQEANGYTLSHAFGAHSQYKIHASKVVQLKDNRAILHDVKIELYDTEGGRVDRIEGDEFEYDEKTKTATAAGPVDITLMRPGVAPAIAPKASEKAVTAKNKGKNVAEPVAAAAQTAAGGEIHVKTSGLTFNEQTGVATTTQRVDFSMVQGTGSSTGATYDSKAGHLVLDRAVELNTQRAGEPVHIHAEHAEFQHASQECQMHVAKADYRDGEATAGDAKIQFREDGSVIRLDAVNGFTMTTVTGAHLAAPTGSLDFNEHNQPRHGHLEGGVKMDSLSDNGSQRRQVHGASPAADFEFTAQGALHHAHMERGVEMQSDDLSQPLTPNAKDGPLKVSHTWHSPVADVDFRDAGHGQVEPARILGVQGVVVTGESQRGSGPVVPSKLAADTVTGEFGPDSVLSTMIGIGNARMEETSATGTHETASGDRVDAHFAAAPKVSPAERNAAALNRSGHESSGAGQIQSAMLDGHVVLTQDPAARQGAQPEASLRATAGHAVYEGTGEWLHLTVNPRVEDGGLQLTADKVDVSRDSGDAFAHGNVKATWLDSGTDKTGQGRGQQNSPAGQVGQGTMALGGRGPAHAISTDAQLHQATGEVTFRGHARLWQQANSVAGPVIVLDRQKQTLVARSTDPAEPVRAILLSAAGAAAPLDAGKNSAKGAADKQSEPSVIRVRGGDLKYSDAEHKAVMRAGALGTVQAETGTANSVSNEVELLLLPPGNHAGKDGGQAQVDRLTARGHVTLTSGGRRGTGEQLVYTSESAEYVLTGTAATPPRMTDPARGNVTGEALIFHSRDDSVSVEGGTTRTETTAPK